MKNIKDAGMSCCQISPELFAQYDISPELLTQYDISPELLTRYDIGPERWNELAQKGTHGDEQTTRTI